MIRSLRYALLAAAVAAASGTTAVTANATSDACTPVLGRKVCTDDSTGDESGYVVTLPGQPSVVDGHPGRCLGHCAEWTHVACSSPKKPDKDTDKPVPPAKKKTKPATLAMATPPPVDPGVLTATGSCAAIAGLLDTCADDPNFQFLIVLVRFAPDPFRAVVSGCFDIRQPTPDQVIEGLIRELQDSIKMNDPPVIVQPEAGRPLPFGLKAFFQVGDAPQDPRTATIAGETGVLVLHDPEYTWDFGDGVIKRTTLTGGPYPDGNWTHLYKHPSNYTVKLSTNFGVTVHFAGRFGNFDVELDAVDQVAPSVTTVNVVEAHAVLVD